MTEPEFLSLDEVLRIHARSLAEHGGLEGQRDPGLVESALASARAFIDGNKRTAVAAALVFLARNGVYACPPKWELYTAMIDIAEKKTNKTALAALFRRAAEQH